MESLHGYVLARLKPMSLSERKEIAADAHVSFWTLQKYAYEQTGEPSAVKLERIAEALRRREAAHAN